MIQSILDRASTAFAGAGLGFLVAEHGFGVKGLEQPESFAYVGLIFALAALGIVRMRRGSAPLGLAPSQPE